MTRGLLISRKNKLKLQKQSLTDPSALNIQTYRNYRNLYNKLIRTSKKISIGESIQNNAKNPKKTWDILKEVTSGQSKQEQIDKIMVNNELLRIRIRLQMSLINFSVMSAYLSRKL
jgi:hypothetical protein